MPVTITRNGLELDGRAIPIYSGTVHYWRLAPDLWKPILESVRALGFHMIETYIPWGVHEVSRGVFDFGETDPAKDLPRFLDMCHALAIDVCVRPGPHINAELTWFGFPERILADPDVCAHVGNGAPAITDRLPQPFAIPSYASEKLFAEAAIYFDALCPILVPYLAPNGPIVACQVDNETCYFFRERPFDMDYSVDSIRLYQRMLCERYDTIGVLNAAYGSNYATFAAIDPPREFVAQSPRDVPYYLDWAAYKEYQVITALKRIAVLLTERGISVPLYHDIAFQVTTPIDTVALEAQFSFVGTNLYANQEDYATIVARRVRYQVGTQRLPFVPEFGAGMWWSHSRTFTPAEQEFTVLAALAHGLRAINFYMLVERDRWTGSPITRDNRLRAGYADFFRKLSDLLETTGLLASEKECSVLVLQNFELNRFTASAAALQDAYLGLLSIPAELSRIDHDLGYQVDPGRVGNLHVPDSWFSLLMATLEAAQVEYDLSDTHCPPETLARYPIVCVPTADFMDAAEQTRLVDYASAGGHLVFGPIAPTLDRLMNPSHILSHYLIAPGTVAIGKGWLTLLTDGAAVNHTLVAPYANRVLIDNRALRLTLRTGSAGTLCFLINPTMTAQSVTLTAPGTLHGLWNATGETPAGQPLSLSLSPYTVQIWELSNDPQ